MTVVEPQTGEAAEAARAGQATLAGILGACPYLRSADGPWHGALPSRQHRCARAPHGDPPSLDHQRAHCLGAGHETCPVYVEAPMPTGDPHGRFLPPVPVVVEQGNPPLRVPRADRRLAAPFAVIVAGVVLAALAFIGPLGGRATPTPAASPSAPVAVASAAASPSIAPSTTPPSPSPSPSASPSPTPSGSPRPSSRPSATPRPSPSLVSTGTYVVKRGDILYNIAVKYHTTVAVLARLNNLKAPWTLHAGDVLKLP